jgi:hypothetical protein
LNIDRIGPAPDGELFLLVVSHAFPLPMICLSPFIAQERRKSAGAFRLTSNKNQAPPRNDGARSHVGNQFSRCQRPKNNQSRMIIGIGTPNSHNRIPRPILVSSKLQSKGKRVMEYVVPWRNPAFSDNNGSSTGDG